MRVLADHGVAQAQVSAIAAEAGVTPGAIYRHFGSKEELIRAAIVEHTPTLLADVLAGRLDPDFAKLMMGFGSSLTERRTDLSTVLLELAALGRRDAHVGELVQGGFAVFEANVRALVDQMAAAGVLDGELDRDAVARMLTMTSLGSMVISVVGLPPVDQESWDAVVRRSLTAMAPAPKPAGKVRAKRKAVAKAATSRRRTR
jgi:AcrR family transcriptional regulator